MQCRRGVSLRIAAPALAYRAAEPHLYGLLTRINISTASNASGHSRRAVKRSMDVSRGNQVGNLRSDRYNDGNIIKQTRGRGKGTQGPRTAADSYGCQWETASHSANP
jgi:hypothetical protein